MRYYKIRIGYGNGQGRHVKIDEMELELAYFIFMMPNARGIFKDGPVRHQDIITIEEDWHRAMGWNEGYELRAEDWDELRHHCVEYVGMKAKIKERVEFLIKTGRQDLIGKNIQIPELEQKSPALSEIAGAINTLAESKKYERT